MSSPEFARAPGEKDPVGVVLAVEKATRSVSGNWPGEEGGNDCGSGVSTPPREPILASRAARVLMHGLIMASKGQAVRDDSKERGGSHVLEGSGKREE